MPEQHERVAEIARAAEALVPIANQFGRADIDGIAFARRRLSAARNVAEEIIRSASGVDTGDLNRRALGARNHVRLRLRDTPWLGDCRVNGCGLWFTASHQVAFGSIVVGARSLAGLLAMVQAVDPSRIGSAEA